MAFGRRPTGQEREAARAEAAATPNRVNLPARGAVRLREAVFQISKQTARELTRLRKVMEQVGVSELETQLGAADYADLVADFNAIRSAVLQATPSLADQVPDEL